ncbi:MAG: FkbM family methyltransferase [Ilumatobacteraceae bacterium]
MIDTRAIIRTGLTRLPWLADVKSRAYYGVLRVIRRPFEQEFEAVRPYLRPRMLCLDVGANHGQSIDALVMMEPEVRVVAFEPQPRLYRRLVRRFPPGGSTTVLPYGVGDRPGRSTLWVPSYNGCAFDGLATTTDEQSATDWFSYRIRNYDPSKVSVETYEIEIVRLDDVVSEPVGFIKLDVQGAELAALEGAGRILSDDQPVVMVEQNEPGPIDDYMATLGYRPHTWRDGALVDGIAELNTIYLPDQT